LLSFYFLLFSPFSLPSPLDLRPAGSRFWEDDRPQLRAVSVALIRTDRRKAEQDRGHSEQKTVTGSETAAENTAKDNKIKEENKKDQVMSVVGRLL
jgi:hypothetical protein